MDLKELHGKMTAALLAARTICDEVDKAGREFTADEWQKVAGYLEEAKKLKDQIKSLQGDEALRKQILELGAGIELREQPGDGRRHLALPGKGRTLGEIFTRAEAFQRWLKQFPDGRIPEKAKGLMSPPIEVKDFGLFRQKTLVTGADDTSGGAFVQTDYTGIYEPLPRLPVVMRDLINIRTTTSDTVEYVRQTAHAAQAAPVPEANVTTPSGATGEVSGEKPEATITYEKVTATVKTIAVWIPATKRVLSDAGQLRGLIDDDLRGDLSDEVEDQIVNGNGVGENFTGILNTPGILLQAWDTDVFRTTRLAKLAVMQTGRAQPTAFVLNPEDWAEIELTRDGQNRYYYGGPLSNGEKRLWGLPVVECAALPVGVGLVGDFRRATMWDREAGTISVSDSHSDFFIRNMIAILAELRAAFGVRRPAAFCQIDVSSGT